jgi:hypothetical protein
MPSAFLIDYLLWVFVSTAGVMQFAAARSGLWGVLYVRRWPRATMAASVLVVHAAAVWFFITGERNQPDTGLGLDANVQSFWFAMSAAGAVITTLVATSIINHSWGRNHGWDTQSGQAPPMSLTWLSRTTFFHAIRARISHLRRSSSERVSV